MAKRGRTKSAGSKGSKSSDLPLDPPTDEVYGSQVKDILASQAKKTKTKWKPKAPRALRLDTVIRRPLPSDLSPRELAQLTMVWGDLLAEALGNPEHDVEVARLVGEDDEIAYHVYAWNYGVGYLFGDSADDDLAAFGSQHYVEIWEADQREVFWAVDKALSAAEEPLWQPLFFDWRDDERWAEVAEEPSGGRQFMLRHLRRRAR